MSLLKKLNRFIFETFTYRRRDELGVQRPAETLDKNSGSCRDFATLFIEACRSWGLAARFVSGYMLCEASEAGRASTHAWAEVYLPGAGWNERSTCAARSSNERRNNRSDRLFRPAVSDSDITGVSTELNSGITDCFPRGHSQIRGWPYGRAALNQVRPRAVQFHNFRLRDLANQ